jgi:flagellar hook assembly protein FlgD
VYNIKGQKVKDIVHGEFASGYHKIIWDGRDKNNRGVSSGIYFFRLESGVPDGLSTACVPMGLRSCIIEI